VKPNRDLHSLGNEIRRAREAKGLSQEELAELAELSRNYVGFIERAERSPRVTTIFKLARALGLHPSDLLRDMRWPAR
jgi:transcriptional regulator with XRE-family HTH domain